MKVVVYSGTITSTTFIERLIVGLAKDGVKVVLHGKATGDVRCESRNVKKIGYAGAPNRVWQALKYAFLFGLIAPSDLLTLIKSFPNHKLSWTFLNWFVRTGPIVWHKPDIFHLQWTKGLGDWIFLQKFGIKVVVSLRGAHINYSPIADKGLAASYREWFPKVDGFHGVSEAVCREAAKYGADLDKCCVVYSGLDLNEFPFADEKPLRRDEIEIISVGRLHWKKGFNFALDAMKLLADRGVRFRYRIIGGINEELLFQIHDLELTENVVVEESLPFEEVKSRISNADILLLSSVEEGIPNVVLEAMALGTAVISTDCGGVSEVIQDKVNGFLVPIRHPEAIADKVQAVMSISDADLDAVRFRARETIERQHDQRKMVTDMKALYESVLRQN